MTSGSASASLHVYLCAYTSANLFACAPVLRTFIFASTHRPADGRNGCRTHFFPRDASTHAVGMYGPYRSNAIATRCECSKQNVWCELKETGTSFDFIATPLWQSVEFRSRAL